MRLQITIEVRGLQPVLAPIGRWVTRRWTLFMLWLQRPRHPVYAPADLGAQAGTAPRRHGAGMSNKGFHIDRPEVRYASPMDRPAPRTPSAWWLLVPAALALLGVLALFLWRFYVR